MKKHAWREGFYVFPGVGYVCRYLDGWLCAADPSLGARFPPGTRPFRTALGAALALLRAVATR
jgi:hypothetical protein